MENHAIKNAERTSHKDTEIDENKSSKEELTEDDNKQQKETLNNNDVENLYTDLINDVLFGLCIQVHRAAKLGYLYYADTDPNLDKQLEISNEYDIFGISSSNGTHANASLTSNSVNISTSRNHLAKYECICPNCDRNLAAVRFAPHLEKCMGLGRNSSRIASRKIAAFNGDMYLDNFLDDELSIQSSSSSIDADALAASYTTNYNLKPPTAKRKRLHASTSMQNLATTPATANTPANQNGTNNLNNSNSGSRFNFF